MCIPYEGVQSIVGVDAYCTSPLRRCLKTNVLLPHPSRTCYTKNYNLLFRMGRHLGNWKRDTLRRLGNFFMKRTRPHVLSVYTTQ